MIGRRIFALGLCGLVVVLAGCAARPLPGAGSAGVAGQGYYKIGAPYQISGVWYYPRVDWSYDQSGIASWYGEEFHGRYTANGEIFNLNDLTAAHPTLPMPSIVQVTNLDNGRSLRLRVNDRGPYINNRIIDVSRRAAQLLGFEVQGTAKVRVQLLAPETQEAQALARRNVIGGVGLAAASTPPPAPGTQPLPEIPVVAAALAAPVAPPLRPTAAPLAPAPAPPLPVVARLEPPPARVAAAEPAERIQSPEVPPLEPEPVAARAAPPVGNIYIQAGAFAKARNALQLKAKLDRLGAVSVIDAVDNGAALYRVRIGPMPSVDEADRLLGRLVGGGVATARIVTD